MNTTKRCTWCKRIQNVDQFKSIRKTGLTKHCERCRALARVVMHRHRARYSKRYQKTRYGGVFGVPYSKRNKPRNSLLLRLRLGAKMSGLDVARRVPMSTVRYYLYETMALAPIRRSGVWRTDVLHLAFFWGLDPEVLFPKHALQRIPDYEPGSAELCLSVFSRRAAGGPGTRTFLEAVTQKQIALRALNYLTGQRRIVAILFFGFDGIEDRTLDAVSKHPSVSSNSRQRVQQVLDKAVMQLRSIPACMRLLRGMERSRK